VALFFLRRILCAYSYGVVADSHRLLVTLPWLWVKNGTCPFLMIFTNKTLDPAFVCPLKPKTT
jgi:hypothetical protein